jgi:hypothetical protein
MVKAEIAPGTREKGVRIPMPFTQELSRGIPREVRLLQRKVEFEFELDFRESTPDPRQASDNDSRLREIGRRFPK